MGTDLVESREQIEQAAATWIARRAEDAWTEADARSLEAWLSRSAGHRVAYYRFNTAWMEAGRVRALGTSVSAAAPMQAQQTTREAPASSERAPRERTRRTAVFATAAGLLILLAGTLVTFRDELFPAHRFSTVVGGMQTVPMSDGSRVTLNTDSEVRISLTGRERVVEMERGEAFFEVAHDPNLPFIVKAGGRRVIAVGTQFSVRRVGADLRVVVSEGTVRYESGAIDSSVPVLLPAGSIARAQGDAIQVQQRPVMEAERSLTWRNGLLTFRNTPLAEAVAEFNRYNVRQIVIEDPTIAGLEVGGVFRSRNVESFVHLLEQGFAIRAAVQPDRIVLTASSRRDR